MFAKFVALGILFAFKTPLVILLAFKSGIRAAAIAPGFIATEMVASMKPEALEKMAAGIPLKRLGQPEEVAHTAKYIFENDYVSGRVIELDAGLRL